MLILDTSLQAEQMHIDLLRRAGIAKRLRCLRSLSSSVTQLARRALRRAHPELTDQVINARFLLNQYGIVPLKRLPETTDGLAAMHEFNILTAVQPVIEALEQLGVRHCISGSVASSAYGIPRSTLDVDIAAELQLDQVDPLTARLASDYYLDEDMMRDAITQRASFNLIHFETLLKIDIFVTGQESYSQEVLRRRRKDTLAEEPENIECHLASPEDVVLNKLRWFRLGDETSEQQWRDILGVLKVQAEALDIPYLRQWATELEILDLLERAFADIH